MNCAISKRSKFRSKCPPTFFDDIVEILLATDWRILRNL